MRITYLRMEFTGCLWRMRHGWREQIVKLADAIQNGETGYPPENGSEILRERGLSGEPREKWSPEMKEWLRTVLPEVGMWPEMARRWLERILDTAAV